MRQQSSTKSDRHKIQYITDERIQVGTGNRTASMNKIEHRQEITQHPSTKSSRGKQQLIKNPQNSASTFKETRSKREIMHQRQQNLRATRCNTSWINEFESKRKAKRQLSTKTNQPLTKPNRNEKWQINNQRNQIH